MIGGEESGGISFKGHIPEGDGPIMGLLLVELIAQSGKTLQGLVEDLINDVGPAFYERTDLRLSRPVAKAEMTNFLTKQAPTEIGGEKVSEISQRDGVKYIMSDDFVAVHSPIRDGTRPAGVCRRTDTGNGQGIIGIWRTGCKECSISII